MFTFKRKKPAAQNEPAQKSQQVSKKLKHRRVIIILCVLMGAGGIYLLLLILPTAVYIAPPSSQSKTPPEESAKLTENRLYIPKLGLSIPYATDGPQVLNENVWHRFPERGDPVKGGNFILSAHRFQLGLTPGATKRQSPFYHINKLATGDKVYVDFDGKRYEYEVTERFSVKPHQTEIEAPSSEPKMTLYSCTLKGEKDGREVIIARQIPVGIDPATQTN